VAAEVHAWYGSAVTTEEMHAAMERLPTLDSWVRGYDGSRRALAALKDMTSQLIGRFCGAAFVATQEVYGPGPLTRYDAELVVPGPALAEILVLKGLAVTYVMAPREQEPLYRRQREVIADLVDVLSARAPVALEPSFAQDWSDATDDAARLRVVVDQVASLTDVSAAEWHARMVRAGRHA
jgi:dGTPase